MEYKVNNLIYAAGSNMLGTIRTGITLTEPVNTQALENAVRKAAKRVPIIYPDKLKKWDNDGG